MSETTDWSSDPEFTDLGWAMNVKLVVWDFDKTITRKHTNGSVSVGNQITDEYIIGNFADLEFFRWAVPHIKKIGIPMAIASFGQEDEHSLLSGLPLIRRYLGHAFGSEEKSKSYFPDDMIAMWHPESKGENDKKVGKFTHLQLLKDTQNEKGSSQAIDPKKWNEVVLFDDDATNIQLGLKKGLNAFLCPLEDKENPDEPMGFHPGVWKEFVAKKGVLSKGGGCTLS
jgi:hypothetical protein